MVIEALPAAWMGACVKCKGFQLCSLCIEKQHTLISGATFGKLISYHSGANTVKVLDDEQSMQRAPSAQSHGKIRSNMLKTLCPSLIYSSANNGTWIWIGDFKLKQLP